MAIHKKLIIVSSILVLSGLLSGCAAITDINNQNSHDINKAITSPGNLATATTVKQDVQNAVIAAQTYLASNPNASDFSALKLSTSTPDTIISISGDASNFKIIGTNQKGVSYTFDSLTGKIS